MINLYCKLKKGGLNLKTDPLIIISNSYRRARRAKIECFIEVHLHSITLCSYNSICATYLIVI